MRRWFWLAIVLVAGCDTVFGLSTRDGPLAVDVPVEVDALVEVDAAPLPLAQQAYIKASNTGGGDLFGNALALSADGSTLVVGAPDEDSSATGIDANQADNAAASAGAIYVYTRSATGWSLQAYLKASNTDADDRFGVTVALSADGSSLAVGTIFEDSRAIGVDGNQADDGGPSAGAVYVFQRTSAVWTQQAYLKASNATTLDYFGLGLAISGDGSTVAVGAYQEASAAVGVGGNQADNSKPGAGAVYVFTRSGITWSQQAYVKASNPDAGDRFGLAVALSDDGSTMAVGAYLEDSAASGIGGNQVNNAVSAAGAAYVFTRSVTTWSQQAYIKPSNPGPNEQFGVRVVLSADGSVLASSAYLDDGGSVYVFTRAAATWAQQAYLKASNAAALDNFGVGLALSSDGSTIACGAYLEDSAATGLGGNEADNGAIDAGAVYLLTRSASAWVSRAYVKASNTNAGDNFGYAVALSSDGSMLASGAGREGSAATGVGGDEANDTAAVAGAVYIFH